MWRETRQTTVLEESLPETETQEVVEEKESENPASVLTLLPESCPSLGLSPCQMWLCSLCKTISVSASRPTRRSKPANWKVWQKKKNSMKNTWISLALDLSKPPPLYLLGLARITSYIKPIWKMRRGVGVVSRKQVNLFRVISLSPATLASRDRDKHIVSIRPEFHFLILKLSSTTL